MAKKFERVRHTHRWTYARQKTTVRLAPINSSGVRQSGPVTSTVFPELSWRLPLLPSSGVASRCHSASPLNDSHETAANKPTPTRERERERERERDTPRIYLFVRLPLKHAQCDHCVSDSFLCFQPIVTHDILTGVLHSWKTVIKDQNAATIDRERERGGREARVTGVLRDSSIKLTKWIRGHDPVIIGESC